MNSLYYGDNLDVLRRYIKTKALISFTSILRSIAIKTTTCFLPNVTGIRLPSTKSRHSQIHGNGIMFPLNHYQEVVEAGGAVSQAMQAFRKFLGEN